MEEKVIVSDEITDEINAIEPEINELIDETGIFTELDNEELQDGKGDDESE